MSEHSNGTVAQTTLIIPMSGKCFEASYQATSDTSTVLWWTAKQF